MNLVGKKTIVTILVASTLSGVAASAAVIEGVNWADDASGYSANIQNFGGVLMDATTEWWVTGPSDADGDGNGYAWDPVDQDTVGGWRSTAPGEYITLHWETGIPDLAGDDLFAHLYGGPLAAAEVLASVDGNVFESLGTVGGGTAGYFRVAAFNLDARFAEDVHYVKVLRTASGPNTGMFFDSFGATVPEPGSLGLMAIGAMALVRRKG
ncbi:MAG: PEP-CTERM sorting domain-containing protein [Phycisphaerae bacterium]|nr:PEP-CTERM sorting domain-containing protein [Phycisphaerae bacterium]